MARKYSAIYACLHVKHKQAPNLDQDELSESKQYTWSSNWVPGNGACLTFIQPSCTVFSKLPVSHSLAVNTQQGSRRQIRIQVHASSNAAKHGSGMADFYIGMQTTFCISHK